jgi:hypothetical protein
MKTTENRNFYFAKISDFLQLSEEEFASLIPEMINWHRECRKLVKDDVENFPTNFFDTFIWHADDGNVAEVFYISPETGEPVLLNEK